MMTPQINHKIDPTLTPAQQGVFLTQVTTVNGQMNKAWSAVQFAKSNATGLSVMQAFGKAAAMLVGKFGASASAQDTASILTAGDVQAIITQQLNNAQQDLNTALAQGQQILAIASVPLSADPGRARLKQGIADYNKMGTAFISQCNALQKSITDTTFAGALHNALNALTTTLAQAIAEMLNAIGDSILNGIKAGAKALNLSGVLVIVGLVWLAFTPAGKKIIGAAL